MSWFRPKPSNNVSPKTIRHELRHLAEVKFGKWTIYRNPDTERIHITGPTIDSWGTHSDQSMTRIENDAALYQLYQAMDHYFKLSTGEYDEKEDTK